MPPLNRAFATFTPPARPSGGPGLPPDLAEADRLLDDPAILSRFRPVLEARGGGGSPLLPGCYLRLAFLQDRYGIPYEALCARVATSPAGRRFCRLPAGAPVPEPSTLEAVTAGIGPALVGALRARAAELEQPGPAADPVDAPGHRRRRQWRLLGTVIGGMALLALVVYTLAPSGSSDASNSARVRVSTAHERPARAPETAAAKQPATRAATQAPRRSAVTSPPAPRVAAGPPADERRLVQLDSIGGPISPKSVDASGTGLVFAQNMMYRHTITVYSSSGTLLKTIPDSVNMAAFGIPGHPGITRGAPVEAAFTHDARYAYVSNYSMYGAGMGPEGSDTCTPASAGAAGDTNSYVYRVSTATLSIDQVIEVGLVPKYLAVSPDDRYLLVANWCSFDLSIVNVAEGREIARLPMGAYPRGIAISPDSTTAYVAIMGGSEVVTVSLRTLTRTGEFYVGDNPRHLVIDPSGRYLYVSLNGPGDVVKVDLTTDKVIATQHTGSDCRSLAISSDGTALYVDNYLSNTITKLRASDLAVLQTMPTGVNPVGITYDPSTGDVWVAVYTGQILVFADR